MIEISTGLDESSLIRAVQGTQWYPEGLPDDEELRIYQLRRYIAENLIYPGMNEVSHPFRNEMDGLWQVYLPGSYEAAAREHGIDFAYKLFTRSIEVKDGVHYPFTRHGNVGGAHLGFRVLPEGSLEIRSPLESFKTAGQGPSLESQWGLVRNRPDTQFLLEGVLDKKRPSGFVRELFTEVAMGKRGLIPKVEGVVATYLHDMTCKQPEAVVRLALPDPALRSHLIQQIKDRTFPGAL